MCEGLLGSDSSARLLRLLTGRVALHFAELDKQVLETLLLLLLLLNSLDLLVSDVRGDRFTVGVNL